MRGGLTENDAKTAYGNVLMYIAIILFLSMIILAQQDHRKHKKKGGGGDSISFDKGELINKLKQYLDKDFYDDFHDSDKQEIVDFITKKINNINNSEHYITVEQLHKLRKEVLHELREEIDKI